MTPTALPNGRDYSDPIVFARDYADARAMSIKDTPYQNLPHDAADRENFLIRSRNRAAGVEGLS